VVIDSERGRFLFKRRGAGRDDATKVAFTHQIQLWLAAENFPLPHLVGTRGDNNSMLVRDGAIYEMFEYIEGGPYDGSLEATSHAGRILALFHKLLRNFSSDYKAPTASYHNAAAVQQAIRNTIKALPLENRTPTEVLTKTIETMANAYQSCAEKTDQCGLQDWPNQIVHGDWHRGNMLFCNRNVVAVIDYDAARRHQRIIDLANGALQFSIIRKSVDASQWPDHLDKTRYKRFMRGYDSVNVVSVAELKAIPYLMCEAMTAEAALPIGTTGLIGQMQGFPFLQMVNRKVKWVLSHIDELYEAITE